MDGRLGLNLHRDAWPTPSLLAAHVDAGFTWLQVHTPPTTMLADARRARRHARALRGALDAAPLDLVLHAPDALSLGFPEHEPAFEGLLDYAAEAGATLVAYHALNFAGAAGDPDAPSDRDGRGLGTGERAQLEERVLTRLLQRAHKLGITLALENLAPVHPAPALLAHDPLAVHDLVRRLASPAARMLLDVGHLHITCDAARVDPAAIVAAVRDDVALVHVHDNLGIRRHDLEAPGVDPLKLDLHLPPGRGSLPWDRVAPLLAGLRAPLLLEIEPSQRPALPTLVEHARRTLMAAPVVRLAA